MPYHARRQRGFTYLGLVILVAILGLVGAAGLKMGSLLQRQAAEQELLFVGAQFSDALASYARATPVGQPQQPASLAALLRDPRYPQVRRHLRKLFIDPITGRAEWGLVYQPGGNGIIGVYSLSRAAPLKVANFETRFAGFEGKTHLSEWQFLVAEQVSPLSGLAPGVTPVRAPALTPGSAPASTPASAPGSAPPAPVLFPVPAVDAPPVPPENPLLVPPEPAYPADERQEVPPAP